MTVSSVAGLSSRGYCVSRPSLVGRPCRCLLWLLAILSSSQLKSVFGASSSSYNVYRYDMPMEFAPDGRLVQLEHAAAATQQSSPLIVLQPSQDVLVFVSASFGEKPTRSRLIFWNENRRRDTEDSVVLMALSGVLADNWGLLQKLQESAGTWRRQYEASNSATSSSSVRRIATMVANEMQTRAFGGGIRPYGATLLLAGQSVIGSGEEALQVYLVNPTGSLLHIPLEVNEIGGFPCIPWVLGGSTTIQADLKRDFTKAWSKLQGKLSREKKRLRRKADEKMSDSESSSDLSNAIAIAMKVLCKHATTTDSTDMKGRIAASIDWEVAVMSLTKGVHRLTQSQIGTLVEQIDLQ